MAIDFDKYGFKKEEESNPFLGRDCYDFNTSLGKGMNDTACEHCEKFMTLRCPHIDEFIEE